MLASLSPCVPSSKRVVFREPRLQPSQEAMSTVVSKSSGASQVYYLGGGPVVVVSVMEVRGLEGLQALPPEMGFISFQVLLGAMASIMLR